MTQEQSPRLLIADDQPDVLEALRLLLKGEGFAIETAASPAAVLAALETREFAAAAHRPQLRPRHHLGPGGPRSPRPHPGARLHPARVVMTAWGSVELAVEAMRRGRRDFIQKPWDNARLVSIVRPRSSSAGPFGAATASKRR